MLVQLFRRASIICRASKARPVSTVAAVETAPLEVVTRMPKLHVKPRPDFPLHVDKKPPGPYALFHNSLMHSGELKPFLPDNKVVPPLMMKMVGDQWKRASEEEKHGYTDESAKLKHEWEKMRVDAGLPPVMKRKSSAKSTGAASDKPKKPPTGYNLFMRDTFPSMKKELTDLPTKEILSRVAERWSAMGEADKDKYRAKAKSEAEAAAAAAAPPAPPLTSSDGAGLTSQGGHAAAKKPAAAKKSK